MCDNSNIELPRLVKEVWAVGEPVGKEFGDTINFDSEVARISTKGDYAEAVVDALESGSSEGEDLLDVFVHFCQLAARVRHSIPSLALLAKLSSLGINERSNYLHRLTGGQPHRLFTVTETFEISLKTLEFDTTILKAFFEDGIKKVASDMAAGRFYRHVEVFLKANALQAAEMLRAYLPIGDSLLDHQRTFCTLLLGYFRINHPIKELDEAFRTSDSLAVRMCHHRSWNVSIPVQQEWANTRPILDDICAGKIEEKDAALKLALSLAVARDADFETYLGLALSWFRANIGAEHTPDLKFEFFTKVEMMSFHAKPEATECLCSEIVKTMPLLLPVPLEHGGTWGKCFGMLAQLIDRSEAGFIEALDKLVESDVGGVVEHFRYENDFEHFLNQMKAHAAAMESTVTRYCFSANRNQRQFGLHLFDVLNMQQFSAPTEAITPSHVCLALLEFRLSAHLEDAISRFYLAVEPFAVKSDESTALFRKHARDEALNYPGDCVEYWKEHSEPDSFLREAIEFQEAYFKAFENQEVMKGIRSAMPHIQAGIHLRSRMQAAQMRQGMEESRSKSPFLSLIKNVNLYYGEEFANVFDGKIGESQQFENLSHGMAIPRLPDIDPEGEFFNRTHILAGIRHHQRKITSND
jgi:hypothetical protein